MVRTPTEEQNVIINEKTGLFTVRACPGSGKTFTVAARLNRLLKEWTYRHQGIATISFTNIAWREIDKYLSSDYGITFKGYPHFLGTIDRFINTYIFLPFGHLVMNCNERPSLCGPPVDNYEPIGHPPYFWRSRECNRRCKLNDFSYDTNDQLVKTKGNTVVASCNHNTDIPCLTLKRLFNHSGNATQQDANYYALKVIRKHPEIAEAVATRFPFIMIDEAQDTSGIQMEIFNAILSKGQNELMIIGDPDQAIYEWRSAEPSLFMNKCDEWRDNSTVLNENKRSSQRICDFVSVISSYNRMISSNDEVANIDIAPEIWGYQNENDLPELKSRFIERCLEHHIEKREIAVLTRGKELLNTITPGTVTKYGISPWKDGTDEEKRISHLTRGLAKGKYLYDNGHYKDALKCIEREYWKWANDSPLCRPSDLKTEYDKTGIAIWRSSLYEILTSMPDTTCTLSQWIQNANQIIQNAGVLNGVMLEIKRNSSTCRYSDITFEETFGRTEVYSEDEGCYMGTVHSVKGETYDAVMLVLKQNDANRRNYSNTLQRNIQEDEELRIAYVGMTRARKVLVLAMPQNSVDTWRRKFSLECNEA